MKSFKYTCNITQEQIDDLMESALHGITYWADQANPIDLPEEANYASQAISLGAKLEIHDREEDEWYTLTLTEVLKALGQHGGIDIDNYDARDADVIVQLALFGKILYA